MSYPYPQDRHRDRREKGEQPYKDSRQEMAETHAKLQAEAEAFGEAELQSQAQESEAEREEQLEGEAPDLLRRVQPDGHRTKEDD
jgi:hypothetical protein